MGGLQSMGWQSWPQLDYGHRHASILDSLWETDKAVHLEKLEYRDSGSRGLCLIVQYLEMLTGGLLPLVLSFPVHHGIVCRPLIKQHR